MSSSISEEKLKIIEAQLGRRPRRIVRIARETADGIPLVLQMPAWVDNAPFPTLYWLCSRDLSQAISRIEAGGWVKQIEAEIERDETLRQRYLADQKAYAETRWQLMSAEERAAIEAAGLGELFNQYGIGGIRDWTRVRCLHMQYAHHLCGRNVIGERLDAEFGLHKLKIRF